MHLGEPGWILEIELNTRRDAGGDGDTAGTRPIDGGSDRTGLMFRRLMVREICRRVSARCFLLHAVDRFVCERAAAQPRRGRHRAADHDVVTAGERASAQRASRGVCVSALVNAQASEVVAKRLPEGMARGLVEAVRRRLQCSRHQRRRRCHDAALSPSSGASAAHQPRAPVGAEPGSAACTARAIPSPIARGLLSEES